MNSTLKELPVGRFDCRQLFGRKLQLFSDHRVVGVYRPKIASQEEYPEHGTQDAEQFSRCH
jgi:hypothetical protein